MIECAHPASLEAPLYYEPALGLPRSPKWPEFRQTILKAQPWCSACGRTDAIEVHHIQPFHIQPQMELQTTNVIVLCEGDVMHCHYMLGHRGWSWKDFDPNCVEFVGLVRQHLDKLVDSHRGPVFPKP